MMPNKIADNVLSNVVENILRDYNPEMMFITGSYVNGYYRRDSDIDIVAVTDSYHSNDPISLAPNFSIHLISPILLKMYDSAQPYTHMRIVPLYNAQACNELSDSVKSEIVRRQLINFSKVGKKDIDVLDPIKNHLMLYSRDRPWRITPTKRLLGSEESLNLLRVEYQHIFDLLEQKNMVVKNDKIDGSYSINSNFIFDDEIEKSNNDFLFNVKNSYFGWYYIKNLGYILKNSQKNSVY